MAMNCCACSSNQHVDETARCSLSSLKASGTGIALTSQQPTHRQEAFVESTLTVGCSSFEQGSATFPVCPMNLQTAVGEAEAISYLSKPVTGFTHDFQNVSYAGQPDDEIFPLDFYTRDTQSLPRTLELKLAQHGERSNGPSITSVGSTFKKDQQVEECDSLSWYAGRSLDVDTTTTMSSQTCPDGARTNNNTRAASSGPSPYDWEIHRPLIEQLYITENVKLRDVMRIMKENFTFIAT